MATATPDELDVDQEFRYIDIDLIDDPKQPVRETMDEDKFRDLVLSIKAVGLIEPLVVQDNNDRFEVVAGHRRCLACRIAGVQKPPCMIRRNKRVSNLAIMIHENAFREDMNPIEQARFYLRALLEEANNDVDQLCEMLKRDRAHVEGRLLLLQGHAPVVAALEQGRIPIATARALNKLKNVGFLPQLLDSAMYQGATARTIAEWVRESDQLPTLVLDTPAADAAAAADGAASTPTMPTCLFCQSQKRAHQMQMHFMHDYCAEALQGMLNHGAPDPAQ